MTWLQVDLACYARQGCFTMSFSEVLLLFTPLRLGAKVVARNLL